jgi:hypothetical protein
MKELSAVEKDERVRQRIERRRKVGLEIVLDGRRSGVAGDIRERWMAYLGGSWE